MSKFIKTIAGNADGIKLQRAQNTATAAKLAQEGLVMEKKKAVQILEGELVRLLDIGPDSADSLRPVAKNFDAVNWVEQVHSLKVSLKDAEDSLAIAQATYDEWFSEVK